MDIPVPIGLTFIGVVLFLVWQFYQRKIERMDKMPEIPQALPSKGFEVPVLAAFIGIKKLPRQISHTYNNLYPSLTLFEDHIECRVILKHPIFYQNIEKIDIWDTIGTRNLHVYVKGKQSLFTVNVFNRRNLGRILLFLKHKGGSIK